MTLPFDRKLIKISKTMLELCFPCFMHLWRVIHFRPGNSPMGLNPKENKVNCRILHDTKQNVFECVTPENDLWLQGRKIVVQTKKVNIQIAMTKRCVPDTRECPVKAEAMHSGWHVIMECLVRLDNEPISSLSPNQILVQLNQLWTFQCIK